MKQINKITDVMKRKKKYDYSDVQELKVAVMRAFPKKNNSAPGDDGMVYRSSTVMDKLCDQADQRIAEGTYTYDTHQALKYKLVNLFNK